MTVTPRADRSIRVIGARPVHPGRGEPSRIELAVELMWLKGSNVASEVLSEDGALRLASDLLAAIRAVRK